VSRLCITNRNTLTAIVITKKRTAELSIVTKDIVVYFRYKLGCCRSAFMRVYYIFTWWGGGGKLIVGSVSLYSKYPLRFREPFLIWA
jgi:hypothetical protein